MSAVSIIIESNEVAMMNFRGRGKYVLMTTKVLFEFVEMLEPSEDHRLGGLFDLTGEEDLV